MLGCSVLFNLAKITRNSIGLSTNNIHLNTQIYGKFIPGDEKINQCPAHLTTPQSKGSRKHEYYNNGAYNLHNIKYLQLESGKIWGSILKITNSILHLFTKPKISTTGEIPVFILKIAMQNCLPCNQMILCLLLRGM
jgi:hypothetical protein